MDVTNSIKRAPRWAWYTAAGVGVGAAALKLYKGRAADSPTQAASDATAAGTYGTPILTASPTSVITPPVVGVSQGSDDGSLLDMMQLYIGAVGSTIDQLSGVYAPVAATEQQLLTSLPGMWQNIYDSQNTNLQTALQSAPSPSSAVQAPPQVIVNIPASSPPVQSAPAATAQNKTHTKDNGLSGAARKVWCMCGDHKVADGACWGEGYACT
jgi:hypothetical protein